MNSSDTDLAVTASNKVLSEYFCPVKPIHIWVLSDRTMFKVTAAITIILCPVVVLLNILVVLAAKTKRELKEHNSNILLASLALADVLTGIISMPLATSLDVLILLRRFLYSCRARNPRQNAWKTFIRSRNVKYFKAKTRAL